MHKEKRYTIWITDEAARSFLGIDPQPSDAKFNTRWYIDGVYQGSEDPAGFWTRIARVVEWSATGAARTWEVSPADCLILWRSVITIQPGDEPPRLQLLN